MTEEEARKRVKEIKGFYGHFTSYVVVSIFFFALNMLTSPGEFWFFYPMLGWGIGLGIHAMNTFNPFGSPDWEERKVQELMDQDPEYYYQNGQIMRDMMRDEMNLLQENFDGDQRLNDIVDRLDSLEEMVRASKADSETPEELKKDDYQPWTEHESDKK